MAMPAMPEDVHQRTGHDQEKRRDFRYVGPECGTPAQRQQQRHQSRERIDVTADR
jgi:hypothetical protein